MLDALSYDFMQNALAAALLASVACGVIGSLVVVNRLVFLAGGVAHTAYGGVGLAFATGLPVLPCTIGVTLAASATMARVTLRSRHRADAVIGALWAAGMAMGILLIDLTPGYAADLMSYLFGSILAVPRSDVWIMAALDVLVLLAVVRFYRPFLAMSLDAEFAEARGVPVQALHFLLLALTAVSVVMVIRVVGLVLVMALITIPPFMAEPFSRSLARMMVLASALAMVFCVVGLALSYSLDLSAGAAIIAVASLSFFLTLPVRRRARLEHS
ncbi:MAG: metal ABC transporter permease [Desulfovibrionaceae bacterium]|jgi:zinc transport system permease protein|nr:metal ABC transporter permease [Desulfovibrionaceae bacterium]